MRNSLFAALFVLCTSALLAAPKGPEIDLVNNKLSISADSVSLGQLLRLLDTATGMQSKVPATLANRNLSVKFSGLSLEDGIRKMFQGQPFDYVVVEGQGVIITAASQSAGGPESAPVYNNPPANAAGVQPFQPEGQIEQPFVQEVPPGDR